MELTKAKPSRRCTECGRYQAHEQLTAVNTEDGGVTHVCSDCLDDDPAAKQAYQKSWAEALEVIDEALAKSRNWRSDSLAKARAQDRVNRFDAIENFGKMVAHYRRRWDSEDRLVDLLKSEMSRHRDERRAKRAKNARRVAEAAALQKSADEQALAVAQAEQLAEVERFNELRARINQVYERATRVKRVDYGAIAALAKADQESARWSELAARTMDPDLRQVYLARAAGEDPDAD